MESIGVEGYSLAQASLTEVFEKHKIPKIKKNDQENPQIDSSP